MAKRTHRPPLRIGDPVPPDEVKWLLAFRALPKDLQRAVGECIRSMPPGISGDERVRRVCLAFSHPLDVINAIIVQERRARFRIVSRSRPKRRCNRRRALLFPRR